MEYNRVGKKYALSYSKLETYFKIDNWLLWDTKCKAECEDLAKFRRSKHKHRLVHLIPQIASPTHLAMNIQFYLLNIKSVVWGISKLAGESSAWIDQS